MGANPISGKNPTSAQTVTPPHFLRRLRIGPRVVALLIIPAVMLLVAIGLAAATGQRSLRDVQAFEGPLEQLVVTVHLLDAMADERSASLMTPGNTPEAIEAARSATDAAFDRFSLETRPDILGENLLIDTDKRIGQARNLAVVQARPDVEKQASYNDIILNTLDRVEQVAPAAPQTISDAADGYVAMINAHARASMGQETALVLLLQADGRGSIPDPDAVDSVIANFAVEATYLRQFLNNAEPASLDNYQSMIESPDWRLTSAARDSLPHTSADEALWSDIDPDEYALASTARVAALRELRDTQLARLRVLLNESIAGSQDRLLAFALLTGLSLVLFGLAALAIRRSVARPLAMLVTTADSLVEGRVHPIEDSGRDELAAFASAFSRLHDQMTGLWQEADDVRRRVESGAPGARFDVNRREGDWLRLVRGFNQTLGASESTSRRLVAEASRRHALARITNSAVVASNPASVARSMLDELSRLDGVRRCFLAPAAGRTLVDPTLERIARPGAFVTGGAVALTCNIESGDTTLARVIVEFDGTDGDEERLATERTIEAACRMIAETHRRYEAETQVRYQTEHDLVTGLPTVEVFESWAARQMTDPAMSQLTVLSLALANAPILKTTLGQQVFDDVLRASTQRLQESCGARAMVALADSHQFLIGLPGATSAESRATSIADALREPLLADSGAIDVRITGGYAVAGYFDEAEDVIANAMTAGVEAMRGDSPDIVAFRPQLRTRMARALELERWFDTATSGTDMLSIWYQPIVDAEMGQVVGYEALARGFDATGGSISPAEFVPVLEESGRIRELGLFASTRALQEIDLLPGALPYVSVNVSPAELRGSDLIQRLDALDWQRIDRSRLALEITEGLALIDDEELLETLGALRERGHSIIIDDFGTGYSSLAYLNRLPATAIKLDRSLIANIDTDESELAVATGAVEMAHATGLAVVAEGVERVTQLEVLRRIRCEYVQGFLTGRPSPVESTAGALRPLQPNAPHTSGATRLP